MIDLRENKILKIVSRIVKILVYGLLICIVFVIITQRVSGNSVALCGLRIFNVVSGSMMPDYEKGDLIIVAKKNTKDIKVGDDLVYQGDSGQVEGKVVTHRILTIDETPEGRVFHTKGLINMIEDPIVKENQIYGVVVHRMILLSYINKLMYNIYAFYFITVVPIGIIIFLEIKDIRERLKENEY